MLPVARGQVAVMLIMMEALAPFRVVLRVGTKDVSLLREVI